MGVWGRFAPPRVVPLSAILTLFATGWVVDSLFLPRNPANSTGAGGGGGGATTGAVATTSPAPTS